MQELPKKPKVLLQFQWLEQPTQETIEALVRGNITVKMDTYLKKIAANYPQAEVVFDIKITKNKRDRYDGVFVLSYPGAKEDIRYEREDFSDLLDLVNHAFKNFKERLGN